ncbi:MAG: hypothetical protein FJ102_08005 [Deltaproteobacteria bacterium]|nr:hypothetical protein [Deltaproteobacteria bacterium]
MAGERKGTTYEAVFKIVLEELVRAGALKGTVFWNETPSGMTIEPDFTVGTNKDRPTHLFLITHSGAAGNSHMKFWRNIGELAEAKTRLATIPSVFSVAFDGVIKADLKALQSAAFDGELVVGDLPVGKRLRAWVDTHASKLPTDQDARVTAIKADPTMAPLIKDLVARVRAMVGTPRDDLAALWSMERSRKVGQAPAARDTFLRRGVGKLLLLDDIDHVDGQGRFQVGTPTSLVDALKTMGLASNSIAGVRLSDPQMLWALKNLTRADLKVLHKSREVPRVAEWIESLMSLAGVQAQLKYLAEHWAELTTAKGLLRHLQDCHRDPHALCPKAVPAGHPVVWLFLLVMEWVKLAGGTRTAFGLAVLTGDLERLAEDVAHQRRVRTALGRAPHWRSANTIDRALRDWHSTSTASGHGLSDDDLARLADALSIRLLECRQPDPKADAEEVVSAVVQTTLEAKLLTYRGFSPFESMLASRLMSLGKPLSTDSVRACFAEAAEAHGADLNPLSASTTVAHVGKTLVNWQSASDEGRDHKKKELCGRAVALRYEWDTKAKTYRRRAKVEKLVLIVDGTWRQSDLDALVRAGWDEVYYPDEMDKLVLSLV